MKVYLGVVTCDKCGEVMEKGQSVLVIAEGMIEESGEMLTFRGSGVPYACHLSCWDGVADVEGEVDDWPFDPRNPLTLLLTREYKTRRYNTN